MVVLRVDEDEGAVVDTRVSLKMSPAVSETLSDPHPAAQTVVQTKRYDQRIPTSHTTHYLGGMQSSAIQSSTMSLAGWWGIIGNCVLLAHAVSRLYPHAIEPFARGMSTGQWFLYALCVVFMAYSEGYKGFQKSFSPRVIARAKALSQEPSLLLRVLAPLYCFGLIAAPRKRLIISWALLVGIVLLVVLVRQLSYPWRPIVDGGVVVGLSWGLASIVILTLTTRDQPLSQ